MKLNIPEQISKSLKDLGYHTRQKRNGDITFWSKLDHKWSVAFLNEEKTSFTISFKIGELDNNHQHEVGLACCVNVNPKLLLAKLLVEEEDNRQYLYAKLNYTCFSDYEAKKLIKPALEFLYFAVESACEYMNKNVLIKTEDL